MHGKDEKCMHSQNLKGSYDIDWWEINFKIDLQETGWRLHTVFMWRRIKFSVGYL